LTTINLEQATINRLSQQIREKEISPIELTVETLNKIHDVNASLNAFTTVTEEYAMKKAREAENDIMSGKYLGPLHGIPYSLKDLIDTKGILTTYGYSSHQDYIPDSNAAVYEKMESSGAVLIGKVNCHFRRSVPVECKNPWDITRTPGYSSSGSGSAVAASLGLVSIGSDTGGSVRIPAAHCGVVGMRASFGLISRHNLFGPSWSFDQAGPLAKSVEDIAITLDGIAGHDFRDPVSIPNIVPRYQDEIPKGIKGVKIGLLENVLTEDCREDVESAIRAASLQFQKLGAAVSTISIPDLDKIPYIHNTIASPESANYYHKQFPRERFEKINPDMKQRIAEDAAIPFQEYMNAKRELSFLKRNVNHAFNEVDLIISPTSLTPALKIEENISPMHVICCMLASDTGLPSISLPCGFSSTDDTPMPIGLLVIGKHLADDLVLRAAYAYEQSTEWHTKHPPI